MLEGCPKKSKLAGPAYNIIVEKNKYKKDILIENFHKMVSVSSSNKSKYVMCSFT